MKRELRGNGGVAAKGLTTEWYKQLFAKESCLAKARSLRGSFVARSLRHKTICQTRSFAKSLAARCAT